MEITFGTKEVLYLVLLVILIGFSAFFSGSETALMRSNRFRIRHLAGKGNRDASRVEHILKKPDRLISTILLGNNFVNILASAIATALFIFMFGEKGIVYATIAMTIIVLIFAEITPKTLAAHRPDNTSMKVAYPLTGIIKVFSPIAYGLNLASRGILSLFRVDMGKADLLTEEDVGSVIIMGRKEGFIQEPKANMLIAIMDMDTVPVKKVMLPLNDLVCIPADSNFDDIINTIATHTFSRYPVYEDSPDNIIGYLHIRDMWDFVNDRAGFKLKNHLREAHFIPETKSIFTQLVDFQRLHILLAFVVDEYGTVKGAITLEDILEEIVGEIIDEHDNAFTPVVPVNPTTFLVRGNIGLRELSRYVDKEFPEEFDTMGGLIYGLLDRIPEEDDTVIWKDMHFKVERMRGNRISRVRIVIEDSDKDQKEEDQKGNDQ
ncbi:MAG: CNNM domain-containing protein [Thermodesulfobacteriota bacterium]|nr:CNNM domain-containing protein [Thermodesulfobacteriota bacterium]